MEILYQQEINVKEFSIINNLIKVNFPFRFLTTDTISILSNFKETLTSKTENQNFLEKEKSDKIRMETVLTAKDGMLMLMETSSQDHLQT